MKVRRFCVGLLLFFPALAGGIQAPTGMRIVGRYTNVDYGYSVRIPDSLTAFRSTPPAPNHGFGMDLSESPRSYLWVDASYDVFEYSGTLAESIRDSLIDRGAAHAKIRKESSTRLGNLSAVHVIIDYELRGSAMISETINARRKANGIGIIYSINLESARERFERDSKVVEALRREWRLLPKVL